MTLKQKVKTYSFWISLISALLIVIRVIGEHFGWFINESLIMDIVTGICGIFVLLGILSSPAKKEESMEQTISSLTEESLQAKAEQESLTQTIKQDIQAQQMSIEQQIEALKNRSQQITTTDTKVEHVLPNITEQVVAESIVPITQDALLTQEVENLAVQQTTYVVEEIIEKPVVEEVVVEQPVMQTITPVEQPTAITQSYSVAVQEELPTNVQVTNTDLPAEKKEETQPTTEQPTTIDISKLSTAQIKELLVQLLQRL